MGDQEEIKLNPQQELYCQYVAGGESHAQAYKKAGLTKSKNSRSWSRMANDMHSKNINIDLRIKQIQEQMAATIKERHGKSREDIDKKLDAVIDGDIEICGEKPGWNEFFKAINLKAEINGWKSSTTEVKGGMKIRVRVVDE